LKTPILYMVVIAYKVSHKNLKHVKERYYSVFKVPLFVLFISVKTSYLL